MVLLVPQNIAVTQQVTLSVILVMAIFVAFIVGGLAMFAHIDFEKHKKPLQEIDPNVNYTYFHHLKVVTIPLLKYRVSFVLSKNSKP